MKTKTRGFLPLLLALTAFAFACERPGASTAVAKPQAPVEVKTARPFRGPITRFVSLPAEVKAYQQATLCAKVAGYLKTITVDKGDQVPENKLLAEIEVPELIADLARNKAELEVADLDFRRLSESQKKAPDLVMPQTVDDARSKVEIAKANLEHTQTLINYSKILAPFGGTITRRLVDPGAFIPAATSGGPAQNAALLTLSDFTRVRVQVAVPENESSYVAVGQPVKISAESLPARAFEGKVTRFAYALDDATKTMLAEIELPNEKLELRPGMYALARIGLETKADALLLPSDCVLIERSGASIFVPADGKTKKVKVQPGFSDGTNTEILKGLEPEQEVIVIGKRTLADGQPVSVEKSK